MPSGILSGRSFLEWHFVRESFSVWNFVRPFICWVAFCSGVFFACAILFWVVFVCCILSRGIMSGIRADSLGKYCCNRIINKLSQVTYCSEPQRCSHQVQVQLDDRTNLLCVSQRWYILRRFYLSWEWGCRVCYEWGCRVWGCCVCWLQTVFHATMTTTLLRWLRRVVASSLSAVTLMSMVMLSSVQTTQCIYHPLPLLLV